MKFGGVVAVVSQMLWNKCVLGASKCKDGKSVEMDIFSKFWTISHSLWIRQKQKSDDSTGNVQWEDKERECWWVLKCYLLLFFERQSLGRAALASDTPCVWVTLPVLLSLSLLLSWTLLLRTAMNPKVLDAVTALRLISALDAFCGNFFRWAKIWFVQILGGRDHAYGGVTPVTMVQGMKKHSSDLLHAQRGGYPTSELAITHPKWEAREWFNDSQPKSAKRQKLFPLLGICTRALLDAQFTILDARTKESS